MEVLKDVPMEEIQDLQHRSQQLRRTKSSEGRIMNEEKLTKEQEIQLREEKKKENEH